MVKTRRGLNKPGRATKGKKKGAETSDSACMVVEPPVMNKNIQKAKGRRPKSQSSEKNMGDETILSPVPLRSIPPVSIDDDFTTEEIPAIHNNYLPWVDYTKVVVETGGDAVESNELDVEDMVTGNVEEPSIEG
ncbi:hypothetical protein LIER_20351 [Lithospermum erythrorhizon]|uniref:Uncharacterized protein n=1 Tax=Lithospermum erythrorhizon TaxID=34254 RepID=A0AAV3QNN2_LITER